MVKKYRIEFLLLKNEGSKCNSIPTLKNLLMAHGDLKLVGKKIKIGTSSAAFEVNTKQVGQGKKQRNFCITIEKPGNKKFEEKIIEDLTMIFRRLKQIFCNSDNEFKLVPLWDDSAFYYANLSYPMIYEIENLMRKLIYQFMISNLGTKWITAIPEQFKNDLNRRKKEPRQYNMETILYDADFIHIISFLFEPYVLNKDSIIEKIKKAKKISDIDLNELKTIIPKDNWTRYFQSFVPFKGFKEKWEELYLLRCKIAHNSLINKSDYENIKKLTTFLKEPVLLALSLVDKIDITDNLAVAKYALDLLVKYKESHKDEFDSLFENINFENKSDRELFGSRSFGFFKKFGSYLEENF